jgi:pSer/pThr/pTyr-binding forkhead associated (FHA) protein
MEFTEDEIAVRELLSLAIRSNSIMQKQLQEQQIAFVFPDIQKQCRIDLKAEKLIIGWHDRETDLKPDVDFTNFGAVSKGVSRQHAMLVKNSTELMIIDLSSRNGTRINGLPLQIEKPTPLKNKSVLHLADLTMIVFMKE